MLRPVTSPVRLIASFIFLLALTSCFQAEPVQPGGLEPTQADPFEVFEEDIASIKLSPDSIIAEPGKTYTLDVVYLDSEENVLGLVDPAQVNVNVSGTGYSASFDAPGSLTLSVPTSISTGHVGVSLESNEQIYGVTGASVVATKTGVTKLADASVIFPRTDYDFSGMNGEEIGAYLFDPFTEAEFEQTVSENLDEAPLFPVVLEGATNLTSGDLITGTGGAFLYGRVEKVVAQRGGRTLLTVRAVLPTEVYSDFSEVDLQDLQDGNVLPEALEFDLKLEDIPEEGNLNTQDIDLGCQAELLKVKARLDYTFSRAEGAQIASEFSVTGLGELAASCKFYGTWPLPVFGPWSAVILPQIKAGGVASLNMSSDEGEFQPNILVKATPTVQLYPKIELVDTPTTVFEFEPGPKGNWDDVNGSNGYLRSSLDIKPQIGIEIVFIGALDSTLDLLKIEGVAGRFLPILKTISKYGKGASVFSYAEPKMRVTAQWATMNSALNNASSKWFSQFSIGGNSKITGGWIIDLLKTYFLTTVDLGEGFAVELDPNEWSPGSLTASTTSDDGEGNANISVTNASEYPITKVQLGNLAKNSLHGDVTGPSGGKVTYEKDECDGANSLEAKVLAIADTPFFPLGAPFNSQQVVSVCEEEEEEDNRKEYSKKLTLGSYAIDRQPLPNARCKFTIDHKERAWRWPITPDRTVVFEEEFVIFSDNYCAIGLSWKDDIFPYGEAKIEGIKAMYKPEFLEAYPDGEILEGGSVSAWGDIWIRELR